MILVPVIFILIGVLIKYGKMYFLIAGYNTMTQKEKQHCDIEGIATLMKNVMFGMAFVMIAGLLLSYWTGISDYKFHALVLVLVVGVPYLLIKANSDRYKIDNH